MLFLVALSVLFFIVSSIVFHGIGDFFLKMFEVKQSCVLHLAVSIALGVIVFASVLAALVLVGCPNSIIQVCLWAMALAALISGQSALIKTPQTVVKLLMLCAVYFSIGEIYVNFPDGRLGSASASQTMALAKLQADNFIPYNFSRYVIERMDPNSVEVVPEWRAAERPPLMALVHAGYSVMFGLRETKNWMETSPNSFGLFQAVGLYLNLLAMFAVSCVAFRYFGRQAAHSCLLFLGSSYFFFLNAVFTWPKLLMAFFLMLGIVLASEAAKIGDRRNLLLAGIFLGAALLSHEMAVFNLLGLGMFAVVFGHKFTHEGIYLVLKSVGIGVAAVYLPWLGYKIIFLEPAVRGAAYHFFCYSEYNYSVSLSQLFAAFVAGNTLSSHAARVLSNLAYPFSILQNNDLLSDPLRFINYSQNESFTKLFPALGSLSIVFFCWGIFKAAKGKGSAPVALLLAGGFGALLLAALTAGCSSSTVNHVWAYLALLVVALLCSYACVKPGILTQGLLGLHVGANILTAVSYLFYQSGMLSRYHAAPAYKFGISAMLLFFVTACFVGVSCDKEDNEK